jgi:hypothetical protein
MALPRSSHTEALALSLGWWYLRRRIRKRASGVAGLVAEEGRKRHPLRWLLLVGLVAGSGAVWWWRRQQGGGDDRGDWGPVEPVAPAPPEPTREPVPEPVAT